MNTCSETGKARKWRAWVKMEELDRKRRGKEEEISFGQYEFEKMAEGQQKFATPPLCARLCAGCWEHSGE